MSHDHPPQLFTPPKLVAHLNEVESAEEAVTVYQVRDQHGLNHTTYFARPEDAEAYAARCREPREPLGSSSHYVVVPIPVWGSLTARDEAPE